MNTISITHFINKEKIKTNNHNYILIKELNKFFKIYIQIKINLILIIFAFNKKLIKFKIYIFKKIKEK